MAEALTLEMQVSSAVSMVLSAVVVVTYFLFVELRKRQYIKLLVIVCFCSFMACTGSVLGAGLADGSFACFYQAAVMHYFLLATVLWIGVISYQLYLLFQSRVTLVNMTYAHLICWVFPLITTFLPYTTNRLGQAGGAVSVCFIADRSDSPYYGQILWSIGSMYLWVWIGIVLIIALYIKIFLITREKGWTMSVTYRQSMVALSSYPFILVLSWVMPSIVRMYYLFPSSKGTLLPQHNLLNALTHTLPFLQGALCSIVFFSSSKEVQKCWYSVYVGRRTLTDLIFDDGNLSMLLVSGSGSRVGKSSTHADSQQGAGEAANEVELGGGAENVRCVEETQGVPFSTFDRDSTTFQNDFSDD